MKTATLFLIFIAVIIALIVISKCRPSKNTKSNNRTKIKPSYLMTEHEKKMFKELNKAIPEYYIFPQVSFSAILWTKGQATRNRFSRKIADFVITDTSFNILAIIELDDKSHDNKVEQDAERDAMLVEAGYKVLRYRYMPNTQKLRDDILS